MLRKKLLLLVFVTAFIFNGCSIDDDGPNFHFTALEIVAAELPESFDFNRTYMITVNYLKPDGCTSYEGFDVVKEGLTVRNVVAVGAVRTDSEVCTQEVSEETASFYFTVVYTDSYTFKFYTGETSEGEPEYIEVVVPVNAP